MTTLELYGSALAGLRSGRELTDAERAVLLDALNESADESLLEVGPLVVDKLGRSITLHGRRLTPARKVYGLIEVLAGAPGRCWTKRELASRVWDVSGSQATWFVEQTRTIDGNMRRVRELLGDGWIENVWGVGWRLVPQEVAE